jgi:hypothetical protein
LEFRSFGIPAGGKKGKAKGVSIAIGTSGAEKKQERNF